jgi:hypothetical protein
MQRLEQVRRFNTMSILDLVKDGLELVQQVEPGLSAAVEAGAALGTAGTAVVQVVQKGKQIVAYLFTRRKGEQAQPGSAGGIVPIPADEPMVQKPDVALVIDINRRILRDVARYLDEKKIDADVIVLTNDAAYGDSVKLLDPEKSEEWAELVKEFNTGMNRIKKAVGAARMHIFLAAPLPLAFGLGSVWGTVDEAIVYHWENQTYHPVMHISRELRQA